MSTQNQMQSLSDPSEEVTFYGPDAELALTFGSIGKGAVPTLVCPPEERYQLIDGKGKYTDAIRKPRTITNKEMYDYLRLGVSSQCAVAFKALGYETPEDLIRTEKVCVHLPDILWRNDRDYPLEFIDQCEQAGISALDCQTVIRRGVVDAHLENTALNLRQLIAVFRTHVKRGGTPMWDAGKPHSVVNYLMDGTIPYEVISDQGNPVYVSTADLFRAARELTEKSNQELLAKLQSDPPLFRKIVEKMSGVRDNHSVRAITDIMKDYGDAAIELNNPFLCRLKYQFDGETHTLGYQGAVYVEYLITDINGSYGLWNYMMDRRDEGVRLKDKVIGLPAIHRMRIAGMDSAQVESLFVHSDVDPEAVLYAREEGIETSLLSGAL